MTNQDDLLFQARILTRAGKRRKKFLQTLSDRIRLPDIDTRGWTIRDINIDPPILTFFHRSGEEVGIELGRRGQPGIFESRFFSVSTRGKARLTPEKKKLLDRFRSVLQQTETDLECEPGFPAWVMSRGNCEISFYPRSGSVELRPTLACDHDCGFCNSPVQGTPDNVIDKKEFDNVLDEIEPLALHTVVISGGEPTLVKALDRMVKSASVRGYAVELQTNGMALSDPLYARRLRRAGLSLACISLHSADAPKSDTEITRSPGAWERTVAGIDQAIRQGLQVHISHVIHTANREETQDFFRFVRGRWGRGVPVRLAFVAPTGAARAAVDKYVPPIPAILPGLKNALVYASQVRLPVQLAAYCGIPPCLLEEVARFSEIVRSPSKHRTPDDHIKPEACGRCVYDPYCPGLWRDYVALHGDPGISPIAVRLPVESRR